MDKAISILTCLLIVLGDVFAQSDYVSLQGGTCIVAFIKKDSIWLAADSKMGNTINGGRAKFQSVCKIEEFQNVFVAMAGVPHFIYNGDTIWSAYREVAKQLSSDTSLLDSYIKLSTIIYNKLNDFYGQFIRIRSKIEVDQLFSIKDRWLLQVTVSGFNVRHKPFHANWGYYLTGDKTKWEIKSTQQMLIDGDTYDLKDLTLISLAGHSDSIINFLHSPIQKYILQPKSRKDRLSFLIGLEIKSHPEEVGQPINVVVVYPNGHEWLTRNNPCKLVGRY